MTVSGILCTFCIVKINRGHLSSMHMHSVGHTEGPQMHTCIAADTVDV
eukprot:CAMPEP_0206141954 /NCGR_PEP_ID=MMETSP1473-20131121/14893_1 /ASSEMBLY_ACC=CAM_ASM_001109 /TAXON_ID=1461547 /ORGANISM="Stichococcus sp, Strain RCC1054" /LENGTH=47 /DNA_ID= /DNA_START= /DNA_END= /DNA_ORIENTATION=